MSFNQAQEKATLFISILTSFMGPFIISSVNVALPDIQKEFNADAVQLSWIATSLLLATAMILLPAGRIGDIYGRKRVFEWGLALFTTASVLAGLSNSVGMLSFYVASKYLKGEWADAKGESFDVAGSILYSIAILSLVYGASVLPSIKAAYLMIFGLLCLGLFIWFELRIQLPVVDIRLFRDNKLFAFSSIAALINYSATFAVAFLLSLYLQYIKGMTPQTAGVVLISQPVMMAIFSPMAGRLSDRIASGTVGTMRLLGQMTSMAVAMVVFSLFIGREEITPANYDLFLRSVHVCFTLSFILCVPGVLFSFFRGKN